MNSKYKDLIEQFIKIQRNSENTTESYRGDLNQFIRWIDSKGYKLESITTQELATYQDVFDEKGYKETTINRKLSSLTGFIKYLKDIGLADENLKNIIQIKDIPYRESTFMQREEVDLLINGINKEGGRYDFHKERDDLILKLFLYTGLRLSELRNIDINDFKKITIKDSVSYQLRIVGKRDKERFLMLSKDLYNEVNRYYKKRKENETKLFLNQYGNPIAESGLRKLINKRLDMYGLDSKRITPHAFRHTCATLMDEMLVPFGTIQSILGHDKPEMTSKYIHTTNASKVEASQAMDKLFA